jgi:hypothetical protein
MRSADGDEAVGSCSVQHFLEVAVHHVNGPSMVQPAAGLDKPGCACPAVEFAPQIRQDHARLGPDRQIVKVELEHRKPKRGAPFEAKYLAAGNEPGEANKVAESVTSRRRARSSPGTVPPVAR